jgi:hypothetical protein
MSRCAWKCHPLKKAGSSGLYLWLALAIALIANPAKAIQGGSVQLSGNLTVADAKNLADRLNNGTAKVEVEVVAD